MAFRDRVSSKPSPLEVPVNVGSEGRGAVQHALSPIAQHGEARMRTGAAVQVEAVAVEAPGKQGFALKGPGVGHFVKVQTAPTQRRVGPPKARWTAKVWQARVNAQASPGGYEQCICLSKDVCGSIKCCSTIGE
jgi:hypothetical protein